MTYAFLDVHRPGMPEVLGLPELNSDLSLKLDANDGDVIGPVEANEFVVEHLWEVPRGGITWRPSISLNKVSISSYLTESRLVYICANYRKFRARIVGGFTGGESTSGRTFAKTTDGAALVGELRFPWILAWEWQGTTLRFLVASNSTHPAPKPYYFALRISIMLRKRRDLQALTGVLTSRIAAYRLADSSPKDEATVEHLRELVAERMVSERIPTRLDYLYGSDFSPEVGIPGSMPWGLGMEYAPSAPPSQVLSHDN